MNVNFKLTPNGEIIATATPYTPAEIAARRAMGKGVTGKGNINLAAGKTNVLIGDKIVCIQFNAYYSE